MTMKSFCCSLSRINKLDQGYSIFKNDEIFKKIGGGLWANCGLIRNKKGRILLVNSNIHPIQVESEGVEPSSKRRITKLSTCLFFD